MSLTVIDALRRFLPAYRAQRPGLSRAQRRAIWALTHCRTPAMGGHLYGCKQCATREFVCHSCNNRCCPQCGRAATAEWVQREMQKRIGAPYFMVTFTDHEVTFSWKDRQNGNRLRVETVSGVEFVKRYLRHVLPEGLRAIRRYGYCHPAAKTTRECVAFHTGRPLLVGSAEMPVPDPVKAPAPRCPCCRQPMTFLREVVPLRILPRGPPCVPQLQCAS